MEAGIVRFVYVKACVLTWLSPPCPPPLPALKRKPLLDHKPSPEHQPYPYVLTLTQTVLTLDVNPNPWTLY